jgi:arginine-tRNA-protein transferase
VLYRPSCADCQACYSARIRVADFEPRRSQARVMKRNAGLRRRATSPWATEEQFALFRRYLDGRHAEGGMADMDIFEFAAMVEETPVRLAADRVPRARRRPARGLPDRPAR